MQRIFLWFLLTGFLLINVAGASAQDAYPDLLPAPQNIKYGKNKFLLSGSRILITEDMSMDEQESIHQFVDEVLATTGIPLSTTTHPQASYPIIELRSGHKSTPLPMPGEKHGKDSREAYTLNVSSQKVIIESRSDAGIFYGLQTLRQLIIPRGINSYIPEVTIEDYPAFAYRGLMMDFSHGGMPAEAEIKRQIDFLARWKLNQYFFYNEANIEMKGYPLIKYNQRYSQEEIKRIIDYAKKRYIDVIPFVELYGHLHDLLRIEKYSSLGIGKYGHELDPRNPATQLLLKDWLHQYAQIFPSPFIHIGFDETWETHRLSVETDSSIKPEKLFIDQLNFVSGIMEGYGKKVMVWTDISSEYPDILSKFPKKVNPVVWEYSADTTVMNDWIRPVVKEKFPFFLQSGVDGWQHIYPDGKYTFDNIDLCFSDGKRYNAIGYITSVWSDGVQTLLRNSWPFMAYGTAGSWQSKPIGRDKFLSNYSRIVYPEISTYMNTAFIKMQEAQSYLTKCLHTRHTLSEMWDNPFSISALKNTADHLEDYKNARLAAESAFEALINASQYQTKDSAFIKTLMVNSQLLDYTAARFIWAKTIVDRWNQYIHVKGKKDAWIMFYDLDYSAHGLVTDMLDRVTSIKEDYRLAWLSENEPYRMANMLGRFDAEYMFWQQLHLKIQYYKDHHDINKDPATFEETFKTITDPLNP